MTIMYLTFGEKTEFHVQAYLSMLSFRRQMQPADRIVMLTTAPQFYRHCASWVQVVAISDAQVREWQGEYQFFWRAKIKAIEWVSQRYPADDVLSAFGIQAQICQSSPGILPVFGDYLP